MRSSRIRSIGLLPLSMNNSKSSFWLSISFVATGIVFFLLFHLLSLFSLAGWIGDYPRSPKGLTQAHLLVLGWGTLVAMGAVYQLISVVLQQKIYSIKLGYVQYALTVIGVAGLLYGFSGPDFYRVACFAILAFAGLLLFVINLTFTLLKAKKWDAITISAQLAVAYLLLTAILGMLMGLDFVGNYLGVMHERLFGAHLWLGSVGWLGMLITGFSYKLLPMFYLSHHYPVKLQKYILIIWNAGVLVGAAAFLCSAPLVVKYLAWLLVTAALILYSIHVLQIRKHRHKANPGSGVVLSVYLTIALTLFAIALALYFPFFTGQSIGERTAALIGWTYLGGWVGTTILGYMSKIVPFLWWTRKYGSLIGKRQVPRLADLINDKHVRTLLIVLGCSILSILLGIGLNWAAMMKFGGTVFSLFSFLYMALIVRVFLK